MKLCSQKKVPQRKIFKAGLSPLTTCKRYSTKGKGSPSFHIINPIQRTVILSFRKFTAS